MASGGGVPAGGGQKHVFHGKGGIAPHVDIAAPAKVLVVKPPAAPKRLLVTLRTSAPFAGDGRLERSSDAVKLFTAATGGTEVAFDGKANVFTGGALTTGVQLFAEGAKPQQGAELRLTLKSGGKTVGSPFGAKLDVIEVTLDVFAADNSAIKTAAKTATGRFLQLQDAGGHAARAKIVIQPAKPAGSKVDLRLDALNGKVKVFEVEKAGAAIALPRVFKPGEIPQKGKELFLEGTAVSGGKLDTGLRLGVDGVDNDGDRVLATVVAFDEIKATIHSSPQLHVRPGFAAPVDHVFKSTKLDDDFTVNLPLVIVRNGQPDITLQVTTRPAGMPILWQAIRNPADHGTIGTAGNVPTFAGSAVPGKGVAHPDLATLRCDQRGSFRIRAFLDTNGSKKFDNGEPSMVLNLVLIDATLIADRSTAHPERLVSGVSGGRFSVSNGNFPDPATGVAANPGMNMDLDCDVLGGGHDGLLGLDKAFGGLVNNLALVDIRGTYTDGGGATHDLINVYVSNLPAVDRTLRKPTFRAGGTAPNVLDFPILDSGRSPPGLGGDTATMGSSAMARAPRPLGQRWTITCIDAPGRPFLLVHPFVGGAQLTSVRYIQNFTANFCFWTNISKHIGNTGDPAERVYCVLRRVPWNVAGAWTITYPGGVATPAVSTAHTIVAPRANRATLSPINRVQDNNIEVAHPSGIGQAFAWDARS
jgi:hypothetical protein